MQSVGTINYGRGSSRARALRVGIAWTMHALCAVLILAPIVAISIAHWNDGLSANVGLPADHELRVRVDGRRWRFVLTTGGDLIDGEVSAPHLLVIPAAVLTDALLWVALRRTRGRV